MNDELNAKWDAYARATGGCLHAAGQALQQLGRCNDDAVALDSLFMSVRLFKLAAEDMGLPVIAGLARRIEELCGLLLTIGIPLDDETLFLLVEAYGGLLSGMEMSAVFWRDAGTQGAAALGQRLEARYGAFLLGEAEVCS